MIRKLTAHSSLESLKKEAKRWLKELRAGDLEALARFKQVLPGASVAPGLREIQQALAREFGAESWAALKLQLADQALAFRTHAERLAEFLEHAILNDGIPPGEPKWDPSYPDHPSRRAYAARVLAKHPEIVTGSIHAAVICGDVGEVERLLKQDRRAASMSGGERRWEPLLYLAYARLPVATASENSVAIAELLLDHGANPNVQMSDGLTVSRDVFCLAAVGKVERLRSLLQAQPLLAKTVRDDQTALFCLSDKDEELAIEIAELLLAHGADPSVKNSARLTAADEAERNGMDALAQLLSDAPRR
jgi:hypothetical protein